MGLRGFVLGFLLCALTPAWVLAANGACIVSASYTSSPAQILMGAIPSEKLDSFADRLARLSACQIKPNTYPVARIWHMYHYNQLSLVFGAVRSPKRDASGAFFELIQAPIIWLAPESAPQLNSLTEIRQLPNLLLGHIRGTEYNELTWQFIQEKRQTNQVDESVDETTLLKKIRAGRVSGAFLHQLAYQQLTKDHATQGLRATPIKDLGQLPTGIYVNPATLSAEEFQRLSRALQQLQAEHYIDQLLSKRRAAASKP